VIGFGSREAIRTFQKAQGLSATGLIDPALLKALNYLQCRGTCDVYKRHRYNRYFCPS
jgi:peptidoglycan hydrolase-like protein with peptidoglycan-binding domain